MVRERLRFSVTDDLLLLRQVIAFNPYEDASRWKQIKSKVVQATSKQFSLRCVREHVEHLIALWLKEDKTNLKKSGTEEQYIEKDQLLLKISELTTLHPITIKLTKERKSRNKEIRARTTETPNQNNVEDATSNFVFVKHNDPLSLSTSNDERSSSNTPTISTSFAEIDTTEGSTRVKKRARNGSFKHKNLEYLLEKHRNDKELKERELQLEERKIELEERKVMLEERKMKLAEQKFELEKSERESRLLIETENQRHIIQTSERQQKVIDVLLKNEQPITISVQQ